MFALFFSLYYSMFTGSWKNFTIAECREAIKPSLNAIGELVTSIFNNVADPMTNLGTLMGTEFFPGTGNSIIVGFGLIALVLATITSIGIVVMAVKGIKRVFGVFFMGLR